MKIVITSKWDGKWDGGWEMVDEMVDEIWEDRWDDEMVDGRMWRFQFIQNHISLSSYHFIF